LKHRNWIWLSKSYLFCCGEQLIFGLKIYRSASSTVLISIPEEQVLGVRNQGSDTKSSTWEPKRKHSVVVFLCHVCSLWRFFAKGRYRIFHTITMELPCLIW
jgi:hypothetical protein